MAAVETKVVSQRQFTDDDDDDEWAPDFQGRF